MTIFKISFYFLFVLSLSACGSSKSNRVDVQPLNSLMHNDGPVVIFGDSIANGLGSTAPDEYALEGCLKKNTDRDIHVIARNGATSVDMKSQISKVTDLQPSLVVMSLAGNDVLQNLLVQTTYDSMKDIFSGIQSQNIILYIGLKPPRVMADAAGIDPSRLDQVSQIAKQEGALVIENGFDGMWGRPKYMADQLHPNDVGYAKLCDRVVEALENHYRYLI